jgi:hypothetical protein
MIGTKSIWSANKTVITDSTKKTVITENAGQQGCMYYKNAKL